MVRCGYNAEPDSPKSLATRSVAGRIHRAPHAFQIALEASHASPATGDGDGGVAVTALAVSRAVEAHRWALEHGRDTATAMLDARTAGRMFGGLGWLGIPYPDEANRRCVGALEVYAWRGEWGAMRMALYADIEAFQRGQAEERAQEKRREAAAVEARAQLHVAQLVQR